MQFKIQQRLNAAKGPGGPGGAFQTQGRVATVDLSHLLAPKDPEQVGRPLGAPALPPCAPGLCSRLCAPASAP